MSPFRKIYIIVLLIIYILCVPVAGHAGFCTCYIFHRFALSMPVHAYRKSGGGYATTVSTRPRRTDGCTHAKLLWANMASILLLVWFIALYIYFIHALKQIITSNLYCSLYLR